MNKRKSLIISSIVFICLLFLLVNYYSNSKTFYNILGDKNKEKAKVEIIEPILNHSPYQQFNIILQNGNTVLLGGEKEKRLSLKKGDKVSIKIEGYPILGKNEKGVTDKALSVKLINSNIINTEDLTHDDLISPKEEIILEVLEDGRYYVAVTNFSTNHFYIEKITYEKE